MRRYTLLILRLSALMAACQLTMASVEAVEPYGWAIGYGEMQRDAPQTSMKWAFTVEPGLNAEWVIPNLPPLDPTDSSSGHNLTVTAHRGVDAVDFDGFGAALASPLFRVHITLNGVLASSDYENAVPEMWSEFQIDKLETTIHYNRSPGGVWSFWPSLYASGTGTMVPEPTTTALLAAVVSSSLLTSRRRHL